MILALTLCLVLLLAMGFSFWPVFRRLNKADLIFSSLSFCIGKCFPGGRGALPTSASLPGALFLALCVSEFLSCWVSVFECLLGSPSHPPCVFLSSISFSVGVRVLGLSLSSWFPLFLSTPSWYLSVLCVCLRARALVTEGGRGCVSFLFLGASGSLSSLVSISGPTPSAGLLVVLSLTLFVANCETLQPRPQVSYLVTTYLCWGAGAVTLGAGEGRASGGRGWGLGRAGGGTRGEYQAGLLARLGRTPGEVSLEGQGGA